jgi:hypothetical protein
MTPPLFMEPSSQNPQSNAEADSLTGTADARSAVTGDVPRITQSGEERIYNDGDVELVNQ